MQETRPTEIYNLAAQSDVQVSFETPEYTANADAIGRLRLLKAIRILDMSKQVSFYQASTSELYGLVQEVPQSEKTPFCPRSPYAAAKLHGYWITVNYREAYGMHASNGIMFNHESPIRGETFVTRKITRAVAAIHCGLQDKLYLGNLGAKPDWGHARDYVEGMWMTLQQDEPDDFVLPPGKRILCASSLNLPSPRLGARSNGEDRGADEKGYDVKSGERSIRTTSVRRSRPADRRSEQGAGEARLGEPPQLQGPGKGNSRRRSEGRGSVTLAHQPD